MAEYITLIGTEEVRRAGGEMGRAAQAMLNAASTFDSALDRHHRFMDDWLLRLEQLLDRHVAEMRP